MEAPKTVKKLVMFLSAQHPCTLIRIKAGNPHPGWFTVLIAESRAGQKETVALKSTALVKYPLPSSAASDPYAAA